MAVKTDFELTCVEDVIGKKLKNKINKNIVFLILIIL